MARRRAAGSSGPRDALSSPLARCVGQRANAACGCGEGERADAVRASMSPDRPSGGRDLARVVDAVGERGPAAVRQPTAAARDPRRLLLRAAVRADPSPPPGLDIAALAPAEPDGEPVPEGGAVDETASRSTLSRAAARRVARAWAPVVARVRKTERAATFGKALLQRYVAADAVTYARTYATGGGNPAYPRFGNDCTSFVSQALLAGGWPMTSGSCSNRKSNSAWWYGDSHCWYPGVSASYTWAGAQNLANFMTASGRGRSAARVSDLDLGDVLQIKFTGAGAYNPGNIGHTMIVTDKSAGDLKFSYHTSDHLDEPFWAAGGIYSRYPTADYYAWKL